MSFIINPYVFSSGGGGDWEYYVEVTVPSGTVASNLTDYVVFVDLTHMPAGFWSHVKSDGGDIRVRETDGTTEIPFDLTNFDAGSPSSGWLFFKKTLLSASDVTVRIYYGNASATAPAVNASNGRNAAWSNYHRVTVFSEPGVDRTGQAAGAFAFNPTDHRLASRTLLQNITPNGSDHVQGLAWDGTHWYVTTTSDIFKFDSSWTQVASHINADANVSGANHVGGCFVLSGVLYIAIEAYPSVASQSIARFNASDLSFIGAYDVSATGREFSSLAYNNDDGYIWATDFNSGSSLARFTTSGVFVDTISLSTSISGIQGITVLNGYVYICTSTRIYELDQDGTVVRVVGDQSTGADNTIATKDGGLVGAVGDGIYSFAWDVASPSYALDGWLNVDGTGTGHGRMLDVGRYTTFTMACSALVANKGGNRNVLTYTTEGSGSSSDRESLVYRQTTDRWGIWNSTDTWTTGGASPVTSQVYRLAEVKDGTTERKLYIDGAETLDSGTASRPGGSGDCGFYIGAAVSAELFIGRLNFAYLYAGVLSADWLAAEAENFNTPGSFYSVGTEQSA